MLEDCVLTVLHLQLLKTGGLFVGREWQAHQGGDEQVPDHDGSGTKA
jgi:hypothetical protein